MKRYLLFTSIFLLLYSCQQETGFEETMQSKLQLSQKEYISIAYDSPRTLNEDEVFQIIENHHLLKGATKSNAFTLKTKRQYMLGEDYITETRAQNSNRQIPMFEVEIESGTEQGVAIVAADERIADLIAYMPKINQDESKAKEQRQNNLMLEFTERNLISHLAYIDSIRLVLRDSTIRKVMKKLCISPQDYSFDKIKDKIEVIKEKETKAATIEPGKINLEVDWGQELPYNRLLPSYPDPVFPDLVTRHYPLGCAVTALLMVYSHFEPEMKGYDEGKPLVIDWDYLKENRKIIESNYGPSDPEDKLRMVSRLGLWIYNGTKTTSKRNSDGYYTSETSDAEIINDLDTYGIAHDPKTIINPNRISTVNMLYYDSQHYPVILMGGRRLNTLRNSDGTGSHVWVIDGFTKDQMVHANMGWDGDCNGWFKVSKDLCFDTANGSYSTDFWTISKLRKK